MDNQQLSQVIALRARGLTPKAIARSMGLSSAAINPLIQAAAIHRNTLSTDALRVHCWVNRGWSLGLSWEGHDDWREDVAERPGLPMLSIVVVAREYRRDRWEVGHFLLDTSCLGVKDAIPAKRVKLEEVREYLQWTFDLFKAGYKEISLACAQHLVWGAVSYAETLGFSPHNDFARCRALIEPFEGPSCITCGYFGKPVYISGPNDDTAKITRTLAQRTDSLPAAEIQLLRDGSPIF